MTVESVEWIVDEQVTFLSANGTRVKGRIALSAPVQRERDCACATLVEAFDGEVRHIMGDTKLQALVEALHFVALLVRNFVDRGGRLLRGDEDSAIDFVLSRPSRPGLSPSSESDGAKD